VHSVERRPAGSNSCGCSQDRRAVCAVVLSWRLEEPLCRHVAPLALTKELPDSLLLCLHKRAALSWPRGHEAPVSAVPVAAAPRQRTTAATAHMRTRAGSKGNCQPSSSAVTSSTDNSSSSSRALQLAFSRQQS
jgi:hypothetical protein